MTSFTLSTDIWEDRRNIGNHVTDADESTILEALRSLDGIRVDSMVVAIDDFRYLAIGGGRENQYVLSIVDDKTTYNLQSNDNQPLETKLKVGGQSVQCTTDLLVSLESATKALKYYLQWQAPSDDLKWEIEHF